MHIFITGGTGFIGSALIPLLIENGHDITVLTRSTLRAQKKLPTQVYFINNLGSLDDISKIDVIINLAGHPIANSPWFKRVKKAIISSRVELTKKLVLAFKKSAHRPLLMLSGSAIGFYGDRGDDIVNEQDPVGTGFAAQLCSDWEAAAQEIQEIGTRVCYIRTGLVLGKSGGFLKRLRLPFYCGLGGKLGNGKQWMSWIHMHDYLNLLLFCLEEPALVGPVNATAPIPVNNLTFTSVYATTLRRPAFFTIPSFILKIIFGQMANELLLAGQRVIPEKVLKHGFRFSYPTLKDALQQIEKI